MRTDVECLRETIEIAARSREAGNHPFGSTLVGPDGETLISSGNTFSEDKGIGHAELNVARQAAKKYDPEFLERCTLYTSVEPCSMCSGGAYWAGIGTVVYGLTEKRLAELTGDNPENLTMDLTCHRIFEAGQRMVQVRGPYSELEQEIVEGHKGFW
jgi:tRNA(Arg) A34 adenosine deaminase TadA